MRKNLALRGGMARLQMWKSEDCVGMMDKDLDHVCVLAQLVATVVSTAPGLQVL